MSTVPRVVWFLAYPQLPPGAITSLEEFTTNEARKDTLVRHHGAVAYEFKREPQADAVEVVPEKPQAAQKLRGVAAGWVVLSNARNAHYIRDGRSLCGKWGYLSTDPRFFDAFGWHGVENCKTCRSKLEKERKK